MIQIEQFGNKGLILFKEDSTEIIKNYGPYFYAEEKDGKYTSLFGEKANKIGVSKPTDVRYEREKYKKTFEADVIFKQRFIIDVLIEVIDGYVYFPNNKSSINYRELLDFNNKNSLEERKKNGHRIL